MLHLLAAVFFPHTQSVFFLEILRQSIIFASDSIVAKLALWKTA